MIFLVLVIALTIDGVSIYANGLYLRSWNYSPYWTSDSHPIRKHYSTVYHHSQSYPNRPLSYVQQNVHPYTNYDQSDTNQNVQSYEYYTTPRNAYYYTTPHYWVEAYDYKHPLKPQSPEPTTTTIHPLIHNFTLLPVLNTSDGSLLDKIKDENQKKWEAFLNWFKTFPTLIPTLPTHAPLPTLAPFSLATVAPIKLPGDLAGLTTEVPVLTAAPSDIVSVIESSSNNGTKLESMWGNSTNSTNDKASDASLFESVTILPAPLLKNKDESNSNSSSVNAVCTDAETRANPFDCTTFKLCLRGFWIDMKCPNANVPNDALKDVCKC